MIFWALPLFWLACATVGYVYGLQRGIPSHLVLAALPAFLLEATLFLAVGIESWRKRLESFPPGGVAALLVLAAIGPYCAASVAFGSFRWQSLAAIGLLSGLVAFWYVVLPKKPASDVFLLALMVAVVLTKVFKSVYIRPDDRLPVEVLGQAMWIRTGLFALLSVRRVQGVGFGFWPSLREWKIGAVFFVIMLPVVAALAWWIGWGTFHPPAASWIRTPLIVVLYFFGGLWVLSLSEEFFFRGLLQQWLTAWLHNEWAGLLATALLFGAAHLPYGGFPNWRFSMLAAVAGVFYGLAFRQASSIRASMVTHALTFTTMRVFFS